MNDEIVKFIAMGKRIGELKKGLAISLGEHVSTISACIHYLVMQLVLLFIALQKLFLLE